MKENGYGFSNHIPCLVCRFVSRSKMQFCENTAEFYLFIPFSFKIIYTRIFPAIHCLLPMLPLHPRAPGSEAMVHFGYCIFLQLVSWITLNYVKSDFLQAWLAEPTLLWRLCPPKAFWHLGTSPSPTAPSDEIPEHWSLHPRGRCISWLGSPPEKALHNTAY